MKNNVAAYRVMFKIKQSELADKIGISYSSLSFKETGRRDWTSTEMGDIYNEFKKYKPDLQFNDIFFTDVVDYK